MDKFESFCRKHKKIYIYGAGEYGLTYYNQMKMLNLSPNGFIITDGDKSKYMGLPVYRAEKASKMISEEDGVIAGFMWGSKNKIQSLLKKNVDVFSIEDDLRPLFERYAEVFSVKKEINKSELNSILIVRLDVLGDAVLITPFIRELRRNFSNSKITLIVLKQNEALYRYCPYIDELILYDCVMSENIIDSCRNIDAIENHVRLYVNEYLNKKNYDITILPRELLLGRNCLEEFILAFYSNAERIIGRVNINETLYKRSLQHLFTVVHTPNHVMHEVEYILDMLEQVIGCSIIEKNMELWIGSDEQKYAGLHLNRIDGYYVALGLVSREASRSWDINNYKKLVERLYTYYKGKIRFVIFGGGGVESLGRELEGCEGVINLVGKTTLAEVVACIGKCDLYVGANTGLLHIASATGVSIVEISAWLPDGKKTDKISPFRFGAWQVDNIALLPPTGYEGCRGMCRMPFAHCINLITVNDVMNAVIEMLDNRCK